MSDVFVIILLAVNLCNNLLAKYLNVTAFKTALSHTNRVLVVTWGTTTGTAYYIFRMTLAQLAKQISTHFIPNHRKHLLLNLVVAIAQW